MFFYLKQELDGEYNIEQLLICLIKSLLKKRLTEQSKDNKGSDNLFFQSDLYWTKSLKTKFEKAYATYLKSNRSNGTEQIELYQLNFLMNPQKER